MPNKGAIRGSKSSNATPESGRENEREDKTADSTSQLTFEEL
jgi:hypothetical protein